MHGTENPGGRELEISGTGRPLVLLHGWAMNAAVWTPVLQQLEAEWQLYSINLPGHGGCDYLNIGGDFSDWLDHLLALVPQKATWLGWSLGGLFAIAAAARYPERVRQLVLVATTPKFVADKSWTHAGQRKVWHRFARDFMQNPEETNRQFLSTQAVGSKRPLQIGKQLRLLQTQGGVAHPRALLESLSMLQEIDLRAELGQVKHHTQWIMGGGDQLVPQGVLSSIKSIQPGCETTVIPAAGHVPFISQPEHFVRCLNHAGT